MMASRCPIQIEEMGVASALPASVSLSEKMVAVMEAFRVAPEVLREMSPAVGMEYCRTLAALAAQVKGEAFVVAEPSEGTSTVTPSTSSVSWKRRRRAAARVVRLKLAEDLPIEESYLRMVRVGHREKAREVLGTSPSLVNVVSSPAAWFIAAEDMADFSVIEVGKSYHVAVNRQGYRCVDVFQAVVTVLGLHSFSRSSLGRLLGAGTIFGVRIVPMWPLGLEKGKQLGVYPPGYCYKAALKTEAATRVACSLGAYPEVRRFLQLQSSDVDLEKLVSLAVSDPVDGVCHVAPGEKHSFARSLAAAGAPLVAPGNLAAHLIPGGSNLSKVPPLDLSHVLGADVMGFSVSPKQVSGVLASTRGIVGLKFGGFEYSFKRVGEVWAYDTGDGVEPVTTEEIVSLLLFLGCTVVFVRGLYAIAKDTTTAAVSAVRGYRAWRSGDIGTREALLGETSPLLP